MEDQDTRMLTVLVRLALTSNGSTARMDADSGGGSARHYEDVIPRLGRHDAPALFYAVEYDRARDDREREQLITAAADELDHILHSRADRTKDESKASRDQRIIAEGDGFTAKEVAQTFNCGERDVRKARAAAGRDEDYGRLPVDGTQMSTEERQVRVAAMLAQGMTASQITFSLGVSYSTIARDLGRRKGY